MTPSGVPEDGTTARPDEAFAAGTEQGSPLPVLDDDQLWERCRKRLGRSSNEWARGLGREGTRAAGTLTICFVVLAGGAATVALTWTRTDVASAEISVGFVVLMGGLAAILIGLASGLLLRFRSTRTIAWAIVAFALVVGVAAGFLWTYEWTLRLPALWVLLLAGVAIAGYLLSAQVGKSWVRAFSLCAFAILSLMLVTIGRNERVNVAANAAETDYLQLAQIRDDAERDPEVPDPSQAANALVAELCVLAESDDCAPVPVVEDGQKLDSCLPGWTYQAFSEWTEAASIDRRVAATAALARCELRAFDPGAISETTEQVEAVTNEPVTGSGQEPPVDAEAADQQAGAEARARASVDARVAVAEAIAVQRSQANLVETLADGADGVLSSISGPNEFAEFRFSGATWLALLALALLWYRLLEIRSGSHGLGPVEIVSDDVTAGTKDAKSAPTSSESASRAQTSQAIFKQAVVQNVPEPGAVPGAQALAPVGDLISSTDAPNRWIATGVVDAVRTILATRSGYTVMFSAHPEVMPGRSMIDSAAGSTFVVFVRIRDTQNGTQMASMRFESEYLSEAAQMAGYWVAGWIISRSRYVPEWATWSERDAHAFYALQWRQGDDLPLQADGVVDPNRIQAPVNALILAQRAYAYQISPRARKDPDSTGPYILNALEDFARAAYHQPRYPVARYRRAAALSSLMADGVDIDKVFLPKGSATGSEGPSRTRLLHLFRDLIGYGADCPSKERELKGWIDEAVERRAFPVEMRRAMLELAYAWLVDGERAVNAGLLAQLRPSERRFWSEFGRSGTRQDWIMLVRVSRQIVKCRLNRTGPNYRIAEEMPDDILRRARASDSHWQISYNIGCYYALLASAATTSEDCEAHRREAFDWLERCLDRPYSGQLVREWVDRDPDLAAVRTSFSPVRTDGREQQGAVSGEHGPDWRRWRLRVPRMPVQIRFGDRSLAVKRLQQRLNLLGPPSTGALDTDGDFGEETLKAVKEFQYQHDLRVTGSPDLAMLALLETLAEERGEASSSMDSMGSDDLDDERAGTVA